MTTRTEIVTKLANRRVRKHYLPGLTRAMIRQAAQGFSDAEWDKIIDALKNGDARMIGDALEDPILRFLEVKAEQDVEGKLGQDDTLTIDEIIELL